MCPNETREQLVQRLREKHAEGLLLWELENGFEMSPKQSVLVFETAKGILLEHHQLERGKVAVVGVEMGQSAGKRMNEAKKREVVVTLDGGIEDLEYFGKHGRKELRRKAAVELNADGKARHPCASPGRVRGTDARVLRGDRQGDQSQASDRGVLPAGDDVRRD
jgi:hypothetical protein